MRDPVITVLHLTNPRTGGHYRKTANYGFWVQEAVDWRYGQIINGIDPDRCDRSVQDKETYKDMYACGFLKPHHPMPAVVP